MKRSISTVLGFVLVASLASPAWAQRGRNAGVTGPYGTFSAQEMHAAGGDQEMASQIREQRQMMQYQQMMFKQQQQYEQMVKKQQDYLKKHPEEAAKYQAQLDALRPKKRVTKKSTKKGKLPNTAQTVAGTTAKPNPASPLDTLPTDADTDSAKPDNAADKKAKKTN